jgi:hypothetical protein
VKLLEAALVRARAAARARLPAWRGALRPARLDLRLDDLDAPVPIVGAAMSVEAWQERITDAVMAIGVVPCRVTARVDHAQLPEVVRFASRLELATTLRTAAHGIDRARAADLVAHGLGGWIVMVDDLAAAEVALDAVVAARNETPAQPSVVVEFPVGAAALPGMSACFRWARERGADGARVCPEFRPLAGGGGPGVPRVRGRCPVARRRVEIVADGTIRACPFKAGAATSVGGLTQHVREISACDRSCDHAELV